MYWISKLLQQLLCEEFGDGCDVWTGALIALERWFVWAIEDEDGMNGKGDETEEAVVKGSQSRVRATWLVLETQYCAQQLYIHTFASLYLKKPYRCIYSNAQRTTGVFKLLERKFRECYALARADFLVYSGRISIQQCSMMECLSLPVDTHCDRIATLLCKTDRHAHRGVALRVQIRLLLGRLHPCLFPIREHDMAPAFLDPRALQHHYYRHLQSRYRAKTTSPDMASRGRSPTKVDMEVRSYSSSPDPLALSFNDNKAKSTRKATPRKALVSTSPSKQNRRSSITEYEFSSPSKAMVLNTPRTGGASPWRIKVTVQAEPGSDGENTESPSVKRVTRTQSTTIPLKDPDVSCPVKRGRGRPRKSDVGAASKPKRAGTPVKRAARSKSRDASAGAADPSAADVDTDAPPKRKRGRPRKSILPEDIIMAQIPHDNSEPPKDLTAAPTAISGPPNSHKSTRFATPEVSVADIETADASPQSNPTVIPEDEAEEVVPTGRRRRPRLPEYLTRVVDTPPQTELGDRLRARKNTPHAKKITSITISSDEESDEDSDVLTPASEEEEEAQAETADAPFDVDNAIEEPISHAAAPNTGSNDEQIEDVTHFAFDEGATRMPDDTTIIDSENFSMISVDSLPSSGGLTSPPKPEETTRPTPRTGSMLRHEYLQPSISEPSSHVAPLHEPSTQESQPAPDRLLPDAGPSRPAIQRFVTPVIDAAIPSDPPIVEPPPPATAKTETPRLGRVVTAGVALQGVLDPTRITPEPTQKMLDEKRDRLDDLFRGFSEGTRRELQAGLRLGEQLAQGEMSGPSSRAPSSPIKAPEENSSVRKPSVFKTHRKPRESRLLTPEDQDDFVITEAPATEAQDVQYPSLSVPTEKSLPSPGGSEDEMSWRIDTPPVATGNTERMRGVSIEEELKEASSNVSAFGQQEASRMAQQEDYSDIWQEEASRSSNTAESESVPQAEDLFEPGPSAPARGKLPRTWRRKSGNHFQYSDEAESPQAPVVTPPEDIQQPVMQEEHNEAAEEDAASDATDDTGMFFQSNMPTIFSNRHSRDLKKRKADKLDLTLLMNEGESLVPESSPPVVTKGNSSGTKNNPFLNTPPKFSGFPSSPHKSSPLRREIRGSDISSEAQSQFVEEESSLPIAQSSPFHTYVDGESKVSMASDQRQLQMEMGDVTDSTICRVRKEADEYLDAYEPQERSMDEIEEVTEPSRTWLRDANVSSAPPPMKVLSPVRKRVPLFRDTPEKPRGMPGLVESGSASQSEVQDRTATSSTPQPAVTDEATATAPPQRPTGLLTRMTSSLWSAVSKPALTTTTPPSSKPGPHPILSKLTPLPKIEPWTKTHYKTLDKIYAINQKHPALFSPSVTPPTSLSQTNVHLLDKFRAANKKQYIGAVFSAWGYEFDMTEELVVLCQVFCELMSLDSIEAYEALKGREIELGDCVPGKSGVKIEADEVMRRLATVILGDEVRADEREGVQIDRSRTLEIRWPQ